MSFRYEGVLPLSDQELLILLDVLVNKADMIEVRQTTVSRHLIFVGTDVPSKSTIFASRPPLPPPSP